MRRRISIRVPDPNSAREFRHSIANLSWVVFGLVELLAEDARLGPEAAHIAALSQATEALRTLVAPLFEGPPDAHGGPEFSRVGRVVEHPLAQIALAADAWLADPAVQPRVAQSLSAIGNAARDLGSAFRGWIAAHPGDVSE